MFVLQIDFSGHDAPPDIDAVTSVLCTWRKNGQLLMYPDALARIGSAVRATCVAAERDSVADHHANEFVRRDIAALREAGIAFEVTVIGPHADGVPVCGCAAPSDYILFTVYLEDAVSPLRCDACFGQVPLYRVPHVWGGEHLVFLQWQTDCQSVDSLQMNCTVGERFGERQLQDFDSALSRSGRELCLDLEKKTGARVFYFLMKSRARSLAAERKRTCPGCGGDWQLAEPRHELFDMRCEPCRLLSNVAHSLP